MTRRISVLDELTINKIAAGEVVERPASVVKELVENAIDANATRITVEIVEGGKELIKIIDNGDGIYEDDITLAFERHSTSKIKSIEDIEKLYSNGFRGEALSSISSVSKIILTTNTDDAAVGKLAKVFDGKVQEISNVGAKKGTTIAVSDLFYNVPARKKFLKSTATETTNISDILSRLAVANPSIAMKYISNKREVFSTTGDGKMINAIALVYGRALAANLVPIEYSNNVLHLSGYASNTTVYQSNRKKENIFINKRYVRTTPLNYVIENIYKGIIPLGKFPAFFLDIRIQPNLIDPNVHPAKLEVKISNELDITGPLSDAIKEALFKSSGNLIPKATIKSFHIHESEREAQTNNSDVNLFEYKDIDIVNASEEEKHTVVHHSDKIMQHPEDTKSAENNASSMNIGQENDRVSENNFRYNVEHMNSANIIDSNYFKSQASKSTPSESTFYEEEVKSYVQNSILEEADEVISYNNLKFVGIAFNTYIIVTHKESIFMIDQHAAHERVLFEKIRAQMSFDNTDMLVERQELLVADIKEFSIIEHSLILENCIIFNTLGFEVDDFGFNRIAVRSYPILFGKVQEQGFFEQVLEFIQAEKNVDLNEAFLDKMATMACKKAIKANQVIGEEEVKILFSQLEQCKNKYTCPHGRPIFVELRKYEIEKMFKRIV